MMAEFVENLDSYADKYTIDPATGDVFLQNFSVFSSNDCAVRSFNDLTDIGKNNYLSSQVIDTIRMIYLNTPGSDKQAIYTGYPDGNLYISGSNIGFLIDV